MEEEPFNPDYVEVDRVLEVSLCEDKDTGEVNMSYSKSGRYSSKQCLTIVTSSHL